MNSFKTGIGSDPLKLDPEQEPPDNLTSHLLTDRKGNLLKAYNNACRNADPDMAKNDFKRAKQYFDEFSKKRRALITEAFLLWEAAVFGRGKSESLSGPIFERPAERLIKPDLIAKLGYPSNVTDILIDLWNMKGMVKSRKQGPEVSCGFRRKVDKKKRAQVVRVDLYRSPQEIEIKLSAVDLQKWFREAVPNIPLGKDRKFKLDVNQSDAAEVVCKIFEKLKKIGQNNG
jgi:hypothetical protein